MFGPFSQDKAQNIIELCCAFLLLLFYIKRKKVQKTNYIINFACKQNYLLQHPAAGAIVRGSGGVRKLRWSLEGRGKRGGVRIIYYWKNTENEIWMITLYAKNEAATIPGHLLKRIAEEIKDA